MYQLIYGNLSKEELEKCKNMLDRNLMGFHRMMLLETDKEFFGRVGNSFEADMKATVGEECGYLNLNSQQCIIFLESTVETGAERRDALKAMAERVLSWMKNHFGETAYAAISEAFEPDMDSIPEHFKVLESLMQEKFYTTGRFIYEQQEKSDGDDVAEIESDTLMKLIRQDVKMKDILNLRKHFEELSEQYSHKNSYSQVYVKFVFSNLLKEFYDNMPDAKGKVKPKFHEANMTRVGNARIQLVNAGQREAQLGSDEGVLKYWGTLLDTEDCEFLKGYDKTGEAGFLGQVAYFTALYANQNKQVDRALKYLDIAMKDPEQAKEAQAQKFAIGQANLKTKADTTKFISELKEFYAANPDNEAAFGTLCNLYAGQNDNEAVKALVGEKIQRDPNNHTAWALKGQYEMNAQDYDNAIESFKKACEIDDTNPVVLTYLGFCMNNKAAGIEGDIPAQKALYKESMKYLERAKEIDPDRMKANWAYPLYQCYYINYSANDPRTKELEEILK